LAAQQRKKRIMAILVGIDETSGTQNATQGGATSNDVGSSLPVTFSTALSFETLAGSVNPVSATALSGATGSSSTGTQVMTFTGAVQDVKFTDSAGAAITALDSGITTDGGRKIYLYSSSHDNNVLLGREGTSGGAADATGPVAFALYLDTGTGSASDVGATGAKLWMAQFEALHHNDPTAANDFVTLAQDLFVTVNTLQNFSLEGAPSGQNLFLMFGDGTPAANETEIVVTGKHPSTTSSVTAGDTVNTGQGGGGTTIGSNNQMVDPNEGMYFTFVKNGDPNFTVPNLDQNEADVAANIQFGSYLNTARAASFAVVQLQPPKGATLLLTAINNPDATEVGASFITGLGDADDLQVNIDTITVTRQVKVGKTVTTQTFTFTSNSTQGGVTVDLSGNTAKVSGVIAGDRIMYHTDADHNRVLIDNVGNTDANLNASFDIGGFQLESGNLATTDLGNVAFIDDAPSASAALGAGSVTHDETAGVQSLAGANDTTGAATIALFAGVTNTSTQLATPGYAAGSASVIDSSGSAFGADGQAASGATVYSLAVASTGVDSGLTTDDGTAILLYKEGDLVVGRIGSAAGAAAFAVAINASTGVLSMSQYTAIKHATTSDPNDSTHVADTALQAVVTVKDGDGDTSTAQVNIGNEVKILDDGPAASATLGAGSVTHDETAGVQSAAGANDTTAAAVIALFSGVTNKSTQLAAAGYAQGSAAVIDSSASTFGSDGQAATGASVYSLAVASTGVDSGLTTDSGTAILLFKEGALVVGRIGSSSGAAAFAVSIDSSTGVLSMAQFSAVKHADGTDPNDITHVADTALQAVVTVKDGDGDTNTAQVNIGNEVKILDDGPSAGATLGAGSVTHDETAGVQSAAGANDTTAAATIALFAGVTNASTQLATAGYAAGSASVIDSSTSSFGSDGQAATGASVYSLAVASTGVDSGLTNDAGTAILLYKEGDLVVGRIGSAAGAAAFAVAINASTGVLSMSQYSAVQHADTANPNDSVHVTDTALQAVVTVKDGDGDTSTAQVNIGNEVKILDDAPTAGAALGAGSVTHDETAGVQNVAGANDTTGAATIALFAGVTNTSTQLATAGYAAGTASVIDSSTTTFGSDGQAATGASVYSLAVASTGVDSGLTTDDGTAILLYKEGDLVVGRIGSAAGAAAFAVAINASTGVLSMSQYTAIKHAGTSDPNDSTHVTDTALQAVVTVKDGDGDTSTAQENIGNEVRILDDGPTAAAAVGTGTVTHDETAGVQSAAGANDTTAAGVIALFSGVTNKSTQLATSGYAQGSGSAVDPTGSTFGSDGAAATGATTYSLAVSAAGVDSGLDTDDGTSILLYKEGDLVVGRIGSAAGAAAFSVAINSSTGVLSMAQYSAVKHLDTTDPNDLASINNAALLGVVTVKDGDGDTNTASAGIGNQVRMLDDGPSLAFGNTIGTGTLNPQFGAWTAATGVDGLGANGLDISMTAFQLVKPDNSVVSGTSFTFGETAPSPDGSGNYHFTGSVTGDLDNNAGTPDVTEHFTMTVFPNGTYNIDLVEGFGSTVTESTANGSLGAGGPDAVQTLTVGTDPIVFFSAVPTASASDLITFGTKLGQPDFTEAQLESAHNTTIINFAKAMNVSTSGIGDSNNNLQGDALAAIGTADESFVANPGTQFTSAKVFVDNSVQGYGYSGGERMYYRILYADGTDSGQVLITQDLGLANKGQPTTFTIDGGGKLIDAIQLTMATGVVKIPEIQFITTINNLADGLKLGFNASIPDGDGDTATSAFQANLAANAIGGAFDFVLNGTASSLDWFNVDLTQSATKYQVNGFDTGTTRDKLVLLGSTGATFSIDNSGANAVVTVNEAGGQVDTITVVGVDLLNTDVTLM
jgi:hypothetical protein